MKKILIIDDEQGLVRILEDRLTSAGYEVTCAFDSREGFDRLRKERPDLVILDIIMPMLDGYDIYKAVKDNPETSSIPIIISTARAETKEIVDLAPRDFIFIKPYDISVLESKIDEMLKGK